MDNVYCQVAVDAVIHRHGITLYACGMRTSQNQVLVIALMLPTRRASILTIIAACPSKSRKKLVG